MADFSITVKSDAPQVSAAFRRLGQRQLPFATAVALTRTATDVAAEGRADLQRHFKIRNRRGNLGIQRTPASKKDWPKPRATVGWRDYLARHEEGGTVRPTGGAHAFAIPTRFVASKRTKAGKVRKRFKPRLAIGAGRAVIDKRGRTIRQKPPKRRTKKPRLWFQLRNRIRLRPVLGAHDMARRVTGRRFPRHFAREFRKAVRSSKPRK